MKTLADKQEKKTRFIDRFVDMVLQTTESFVLEDTKGDKPTYSIFMQCNVGKARYVYGHFFCTRKLSRVDPKLKPELTAIVSDGKVYIIYKHKFILWVDKADNQLPQNTYLVQDIVEKENKRVEDVLFPAFYNSLEEGSFKEDEDFISQCKEMARDRLLTNVLPEGVHLGPIFCSQDIIFSLCGAIDLDSEALKKLQEKEQHWIYTKTMENTVKRLLESNSSAEPLAEEYEIKIAEGIRSVDAKMVTVEFTLNGKQASEKMTSSSLISNLKNKYHFSSYGFAIGIRGKELIKKLGADEYLHSNDSKGKVLTCKNISRITYRKKALYVRET